MKYVVDNAIIMAAGMSSRFAPLSYEKPKALISVKGEVMIERQIRQLRQAGVPEIIVVVGYKKEQFSYLKEKYHVKLVENPEYATRNNNSSIYYARDYIRNSYICSADNYFTINPFEKEVEGSYYAALRAIGMTEEWCLHEDADGHIDGVSIGGENRWYMIGQAFWAKHFSDAFLKILISNYEKQETAEKLWENIFLEHLDELKMKVRRYAPGDILEFDSLEELRSFDARYKTDSGSQILGDICRRLSCAEESLCEIVPLKSGNEAIGIQFQTGGRKYRYVYRTREIKQILLD